MSTIDPAVREDLRKAWRTARRFLRLQREHPLWRRRQAIADRLLALEWLLLIAVTYLLVFGPLPWPLKLVLLIPWSLYSSLALDVAVHYFNHWPPFRREGLFPEGQRYAVAAEGTRIRLRRVV